MSDLCLMGACLIALAPTNIDTVSDLGMTTATDYTGTEHSIARFYQTEGATVSADAVALFSNGLAIRLGGTSAIDTAKYDKAPDYRIGFTKLTDLSQSWSIRYGVDYQFTGESKDTPCLDDFNREYYCATLTPFSEKGNTNEKDHYSASVRISYQF